MTPQTQAPGHVPTPPAAPYALDARATPREALERSEWILTTGHGGFAMGTPAGTPGKQYHTMLNAPSAPPVGRVATLHSVEEIIRVEGQTIPLARYHYEDGSAAGPGESSALVRFVKDRAQATWVYEAGGVRITKTLRVGWRSNTAALRYTIETQRSATIDFVPRIVLRDFHDGLADLDTDRFDTAEIENGVRVEADGHAVSVVSDAAEFTPDPSVTPTVDYAATRARCEEDKFGEPLWSPGRFTLECAPGTTSCTIACALAPEDPDLGLWQRTDRELHLDAVRAAAGNAQGAALAERLGPLIDAADDFLVTRTIQGRELMTVIAGYPWFADWGRDTMIALPGLMLATGRHEEARQCLETFARFVSEGMVPNRFDDDDDTKAHYNTVDASLWYVQAVHAYAKASGEVLEHTGLLVDAAKQIIAGYEKGTRFGIGVDPEDGLVFAGDETTQLTWMDALRDGIAFTPRQGKCVEINALWVNALRALAELTEAGASAYADECRAKAQSASAKFNELFVRADGRGLYDCLRPDGNGKWEPIAEIRPNQLFAVSLPFTPLAPEHHAAVVDICREHLRTPEGMRTLAPEDPSYRPRFKGDMIARDSAYHNGTVWPWLIGPYCEAVLRAGAFSDEAKAEAGASISTLVEHMASGCLGQITEVYDGDEPRDQEGCTAQAWSVSEVLRISTLLA